MSNIIRMTTPDIIFDVDVDLTEAPEISVTFRQIGKNVLILDKTALTVTEDSITHTFTQTEAAKFYPGSVQIQIKALTSDGRVISHDPPIQTTVAEIFDERVFGNA